MGAMISFYLFVPSCDLKPACFFNVFSNDAGLSCRDGHAEAHESFRRDGSALPALQQVMSTRYAETRGTTHQSHQIQPRPPSYNKGALPYYRVRAATSRESTPVFSRAAFPQIEQCDERLTNTQQVGREAPRSVSGGEGQSSGTRVRNR